MNITLSQLSKSDAMSIPFDGNIEQTHDNDRFVVRVTTAEVRGIPTDTEKSITLRKRLSTLYHEKAEGSYIKLEVKTQIKQNTFQKWMNGSRNVSRKELAKFAVGLALDMEIVDELFRMIGHSLDYENNRFDFIVACAIRDKDDIEQFGNDVEKYCGISIF